MIKRIDFIKNMGVFHDFRWQESVRDKGNNICELERVNIFYGYNYSGKTTLSRIFRAIELGGLPECYRQADFQLSFDNSKPPITNETIDQCKQSVCVFNKDFIKDNLEPLITDQGDIKSLLIM